MSETSSKASTKRLKTLSEALRERLSPESWLEIFGDEPDPQSEKSSKERTT